MFFPYDFWLNTLLRAHSCIIFCPKVKQFLAALAILIILGGPADQGISGRF